MASEVTVHYLFLVCSARAYCRPTTSVILARVIAGEYSVAGQGARSPVTAKGGPEVVQK